MIRRLIKLSALAAALAVPASSLAADDSQPPSVSAYLSPQTIVRLPGGRNYNLVCEGSGSPVAILDGSLSQWSFEWRGIQPALSRITKTCAVDRAGFGFSDSGPLPRDAAAEVTDLQNALQAAKIKGPYVLVGHSLGGQEMRLLAYRWPSKVEGLLLIDPGIEHQDQRLPHRPGQFDVNLAFWRSCLDEAKAGKIIPGVVEKGSDDACSDPPNSNRPLPDQKAIIALESRPSNFATIIAELEAYNGSTSTELDAARHNLGAIPLTILASDKAHFTADRPEGVDADALYNAWISGQKDQARDSTRGQHRVVEGASHWVFNEHPEVVISAFRDIVEAGRKSGVTAAGS